MQILAILWTASNILQALIILLHNGNYNKVLQIYIMQIILAITVFSLLIINKSSVLSFSCNFIHVIYKSLSCSTFISFLDLSRLNFLPLASCALIFWFMSVYEISAFTFSACFNQSCTWKKLQKQYSLYCQNSLQRKVHIFIKSTVDFLYRAILKLHQEN